MTRYRTLDEWLIKEKGYDTREIMKIRQYVEDYKCTNVYAAYACKGVTKEDLELAVKNIWGFSLYEGDLTKISMTNTADILDMIKEKYIAFVSKEKSNTVVIILVDIMNRLMIMDNVKKKYPNCKQEVYYIFEDDFNSWKALNNSQITNNEMQKMYEGVELVQVAENSWDADEDEDAKDEAKIAGIVNKMIITAVKVGASDIHIEPRERDVIVKFRIDGVLKDNNEIPNRGYYKQIVNRIKVLASMDVTIVQKPQSGKIRLNTKLGSVDLRVSTLPTIYGEKVTMRVLSEEDNKIRTLEQLGVTPEYCTEFRKMMGKNNGIILISGPTGSGKSSTLASMLTELACEEKCLITIEEPVEYKIEGACQVNVNNAVGLTFATVLREILRQDPDIIMVGEIRDKETAQIAMTASNTGHLVLSTILTNSAASTLTRLVDIGIDTYMVADTIIGIVAQQLVRKLCPKCKKEHLITEDDVERLGISEEYIGKVSYEAVGCTHCNNTGYKGRTVVLELLEVEQGIIKLIHNGASFLDIENYAIDELGFKKKLSNACDLIEQGVTSVAEVYRVIGSVK